MHRDKASLVYGDKPQALRCYELLDACCEHTFISLRSEQRTDELFNDFSCIDDQESDLGPMGGLISAMDTHPQAAWLALACDLPLISKHALEFLLSRRADGDVTAFRARDQKPEPLCAIYEPKCRADIRACLDDRRLSMRDFLRDADVHLVRPEEAETLTNINTIEERDALLDSLRTTPEVTR